MADEEVHLSDQDILRASDGEFSRRRATQVRTHLAACWLCRTRLREIDAAIADFVDFHRGMLDPQLPPVAGPSALLKARLAEFVDRPGAGLWPRLLQFILLHRAFAYICLALLIAAMGSELLTQHSEIELAAAQVVQFESAAVPNRSLTPGATRPVTIRDVCSMAHEDVVREVPTSLRQEVFQEYGIANAHAGDYEIDYLIAPGLGGVEDIRNLWPEPSTSPTWNARRKGCLGRTPSPASLCR